MAQNNDRVSESTSNDPVRSAQPILSRRFTSRRVTANESKANLEPVFAQTESEKLRKENVEEEMGYVSHKAIESKLQGYRKSR